MTKNKTFCWIHMESYCVVCENDQRKKIIKDAIAYIHESNSNIDTIKLLHILERPLNPSTIDVEETRI